MTVKIKDRDPLNLPPNMKGAFVKDNSYTVISMFCKRNTINDSFDIIVRLLGEGGRPALYNITYFDIVDSTMDADFICKSFFDGSFEFEPSSMNRPGFWEDFFNDEANAIEVFKSRFPNLKLE